MAANFKEFLIFKIEMQRFAIQLTDIAYVIRAVATTRLSDSPGFIEGVIDYYGEVMAVINLRKRLGYPLQDLKLDNRFIIVKTPQRKLALIVDEVEDVLTPDSMDLFDSREIGTGLKFLSILRDDGGIILIYDLENLLEKSEEINLQQFLEANLWTGNVL